ncbi:MAG TPA: glycosyltransferase [bacterium]|nr:glycosyltransferase [bacterium]
MRIAILNNLYQPNERGGAEQVARRQAEHFSSKDFVLVVTSAVAKEQAGLEKINDNYFIFRIWANNFYPYYDLPKHNFLSRALWRLRDIFGRKTAQQIAQLLNEYKIEKVILHNLTGLSYQTPKFVKQEKVLLLHDVQLLHPSGLLEKVRPLNFLEKIYSRLTSRLFAGVSKIICPSKFLADYYQKNNFAPIDKFTVIKNGVPDENYREREGFGGLVWSKPIRLLFVGQLNQAKGIEKILPMVVANENYHLSVLGDGPLQAVVENYAQKCARIKYYGRVSQAELLKFYDEHHFLLFSSLIQENLPTVILEAGARALPVIAAGVGGVPELIEDGKNGFIYNPFDENSLSRVLVQVSQLSAQSYARLQEETRRHAEAWRASRVWEEWGTDVFDGR